MSDHPQEPSDRGPSDVPHGSSRPPGPMDKSDVERRLRAALQAEAASVIPDPRQWERVRSRVRWDGVLRYASAGAVVAVVALLVAVAVPGFLPTERNFAFVPDVTESVVEPTDDAESEAVLPATPPTATPEPDERPTGVSTSESAAPAPAATTAPAAPFIVEVAFVSEDAPCGEGIVTAARSVERTRPLSDAVRALLEGPNEEERASALTTAFGDTNADMLHAVNLVDGHATIDLSTAITGGGGAASCQALAVLAQLDATVGQFETVDRATYLLDSSAERFGEWLQLGPEEVIERPVP